MYDAGMRSRKATRFVGLRQSDDVVNERRFELSQAICVVNMNIAKRFYALAASTGTIP
jgi:hypothetical protein